MVENQLKGPGILNDFSWGRFFFLGIISIILYLSLIMTIFAPFPIALAYIFYGRTKGLQLGAICVLMMGFLTKFMFGSSILVFLLYFLVVCMAILSGEIVQRKIAPIKGLVVVGSILLGAIVIGGTVAIQQLPTDPVTFLANQVKERSAEVLENQELIIKQQGEQGRQIVDLFSKPEWLAKEFLNTLPRAIFLSVFFTMWINLLLIFKVRRTYNLLRGEDGYTDKELLEFKMPEGFIWLVIPLLGVVVAGEKLVGPLMVTVGFNLLYCLGLFYLFQGYGVFVKFLDHFKITGLIRSFFIVFTLLSGQWMLALIGLFDMWVNFRKWFEPKDQM